jgi:hypothetical protein
MKLVPFEHALLLTELADPTFPRVYDIHTARISLAAPPGHLVTEVGGPIADI